VGRIGTAFFIMTGINPYHLAPVIINGMLEDLPLIIFTKSPRLCSTFHR
jgi:hypothetical protein